MNKQTETADRPGATLWTPWGLQRRSERDAQKLAIRKLVERLARLDKRNSRQHEDS
ncbi:hypothetical protein [Mesorhizobium sp. KR2-14]|uniref:hypothetical protein n=1 Tax=Mesorhizobium sp. KR2-14 TaxID=3156610 RepID=UPI0032B365B6